MFRSLRVPNYRTWAMGAFVSNIGTWMQRTAQDWIVLAELTDHNARALGTVMALQFGPQILFLPLTGYAADTFDRRKLVFATQAIMGALAFGLGILTVLHLVQLWHVYVFAFLFGTVTAFDSPVRNSFVADLVGPDDLSNAVGLNSTSFHSARMIGPAIAGVMIGHVGTGWVFLVNGASFVAVLVSLFFLRTSQIATNAPTAKKRAGILDGFRYVWGRPDLRGLILMVFLVGTFGLNFPIFISTMATGAFKKGPQEFGLLTSIMAIGSVTGALLAARRERPNVAVVTIGATVFGCSLLVGAMAPTYALFGACLVITGVAGQTFNTTSNTVLQMSAEPRMRGRVVSLFLAIALGGTPIGAPIVGWVVDTFGPRWALCVGAAGGLGAAIVGAITLSLLRQRSPRAASLSSPEAPPPA